MIMKKQYTKKQIVEAIAYWKRQLDEMDFRDIDPSYLLAELEDLQNYCRLRQKYDGKMSDEELTYRRTHSKVAARLRDDDSKTALFTTSRLTPLELAAELERLLPRYGWECQKRSYKQEAAYVALKISGGQYCRDSSGQLILVPW